ncbi:MAG: hypothetical protein AAGH78_12375, partial [Cyanobacteria bacterium P01_H01_bin.58]
MRKSCEGRGELDFPTSGVWGQAPKGSRMHAEPSHQLFRQVATAYWTKIVCPFQFSAPLLAPPLSTRDRFRANTLTSGVSLDHADKFVDDLPKVKLLLGQVFNFAFERLIFLTKRLIFLKQILLIRRDVHDAVRMQD